MINKQTPTDEALENLFVEETGFDVDDFPAAIFGFARAALTKWGQPAQPVAREPLTDEQIDRAIAELGLNYLADAHATNRAVLRKLCHHAHGIKGGQHVINT